jgi:hypothetical protein
MFKKSALTLVLILAFPFFCFGDVEGWRADGTFTVNAFNINNRNIETSITYGEAFIFSSNYYSEYTLLFYLKNGGKIEIVFYQDEKIDEEINFGSASSPDFFSYEYIRRLLVDGSGIYREFNRDYQIINETKFNQAQGDVVIILSIDDQFQETGRDYTFAGEGAYELISDSEAISIRTTINSQY